MIRLSYLIATLIVISSLSSCDTSKKLVQQNATTSNEFELLFPPVNAIPVAYLGSYHMSNPGADQFNLEADDVSVPKRQKEIQEVVDLLSKFNPTKIAIEAPRGDSVVLARYQSYLKGELEPRKAEEEQIGFRLAKQLGHKTIYPIDVKMNLNNAALSELVQTDPQKYGPYLSALESAGKGAINIMGNWLSNGTIRDMLYNMNDPEVENIAHEVYFRSFIPIVKEDNYAGVDMVTTWYQRNLSIFSNLHQISDREDDRILVVYGQGHVPLLKQFTRDSPYFEVVEIRPFLEK